jgi:hypothetical protein
MADDMPVSHWRLLRDHCNHFVSTFRRPITMSPDEIMPPLTLIDDMTVFYLAGLLVICLGWLTALMLWSVPEERKYRELRRLSLEVRQAELIERQRRRIERGDAA